MTDARVTLLARGEERKGVLARIAGEADTDFEVVAVNSPENPTIYRANLKFEEAGNWALSIRVESPTSGSGGFETPIVILPQPIEPGGQGVWVFLGVFVVLMGGGIYIAWSIRKAQSAQRARLQDSQ